MPKSPQKVIVWDIVNGLGMPQPPCDSLESESLALCSWTSRRLLHNNAVDHVVLVSTAFAASVSKYQYHTHTGP